MPLRLVRSLTLFGLLPLAGCGSTAGGNAPAAIPAIPAAPSPAGMVKVPPGSMERNGPEESGAGREASDGAGAPAANDAPSPPGAAAAVPPGAESPSAPAVPSIPLLGLTDQFDRPFRRPESVRRLVILMVGGGWRRDAEAWSLGLERRLPPETGIIRVLHLKEMPRLTGGIVKRSIRAESGDNGAPVLLDWEGAVAARYGFDPGQIAIVPLGDDDEPLAVVREPWSAEAEERLAALASGGGASASSSAP